MQYRYKLEGDLESVLAKLEQDRQTWREAKAFHDAMRKKEERLSALGFSGCFLPFLGLFLYGFNIFPDLSWPLVFGLSIIVFVGAQAANLVTTHKRSQVTEYSQDLDLFESYAALVWNLKSLLKAGTKIRLELAPYLLRSDETRLKRESLEQDRTYPAVETHQFDLIDGDFTLSSETPATFRLIRHQRLRLDAFREKYFVGGDKHYRTRASVEWVENEDRLELLVPEDAPLHALPEDPEVTEEGERKLIRWRIVSDSENFDISPVLDLLRNLPEPQQSS